MFCPEDINWKLRPLPTPFSKPGEAWAWLLHALPDMFCKRVSTGTDVPGRGQAMHALLPVSATLVWVGTQWRKLGWQAGRGERRAEPLVQPVGRLRASQQQQDKPTRVLHTQVQKPGQCGTSASQMFTPNFILCRKKYWDMQRWILSACLWNLPHFPTFS